MKRIVLLFAGIWFFFGCDTFTKHDVTVLNASDYSVTFQLVGYDSLLYTMAPADELVFDVYDHPHLQFTGHPRVQYISHKDRVSIFNLPSYDCTIYGLHKKAVTIWEKGYRLGDEDSDETGLLVGADEVKSVKLYTVTPSFEIVDADGIGIVGNKKCGDIMKMYLKIKNDVDRKSVV